jgi:hypothetical protein
MQESCCDCQLLFIFRINTVIQCHIIWSSETDNNQLTAGSILLLTELRAVQFLTTFQILIESHVSMSHSYPFSTVSKSGASNTKSCTAVSWCQRVLTQIERRELFSAKTTQCTVRRCLKTGHKNHLFRREQFNPLAPELNPTPQRYLTRFVLGILLLELCSSLIYA